MSNKDESVMAAEPRKLFYYRERPDQVVPLLAETRITHSSAGLGWPGVYLEIGTSTGCDVDELMVDGHFVGMQLLDEPLVIRTRKAGAWVPQVMPPRAMWVHPEGIPFSRGHDQLTPWAGLVIDGAYLDAVMGKHYELKTCYILNDPVLSHLMYGLVTLLRDERDDMRSDAELAKRMIDTFIVTLTRLHGHHARPAFSGGIAPHQLKNLLHWVDSHIESHLTVEEMAARVRLSTAHFSREFKRSTGFTPWGYVLDRRLGRARELLLNGDKAGQVADRLQFSDLPHLCRAFRAKFGISPSELVRSR